MKKEPSFEKEGAEKMPQYKTMTFEEYEEKEGHNPIYVFEVEKNEKKITYFGVKHSNQPDDPMFGEIEKRFKQADPQIVFVEGMHFSKNGKQELIEEMKKADAKTVINDWGESGFTFKLAADAGIGVESPEPDFTEEVENQLSLGFSKEEIFAYYVYRQANSYQRIPEKPPIEEYLGSYIERFQKDTDWKDFDYSFEHLQQIGKEIWGDRGDITKEDAWRTDPVPYKNKKSALWNNVNRICQQSTYFRDKFMVHRIEEVMKKHDRLFIVFGSSYAFMQEPALRELFEKK